ncbi:universal stress protein [Phycicoccus sp. M110.8]|uniref:universal stress protein n=1 Tax=Phycicoccus sp. M110.8 TaxID=3075433 RepID=UPI0028FD44FD|nr:universal stress protein [Phycicoccus sp. M110.8]MDU0315635.1 universal stress protein [Phycicoccus sp. M110.8]HET8768651.1 universal stress protein [Pedococcus sp.]
MSSTPTVPPGSIVVGVDADHPATEVLDAAVELARRTGRRVHLVNATGLGVVPWTPDVLELQARRLEELRAHLQEQAPREVTAETVVGGAASALVEGSRDAYRVVLGAGRLRPLTAAVLGATTHQVAAHARCPVLVVPRGAVAQPRGLVVVGVDPDPHAEPALDAAFTEASERGVPLVAVHAWWWEPPDPLATEPEWAGDWGELADAQHVVLAEMLSGWQERYPDVEVRPRLVRGQAVPVLCDEAREAQLLVVGSRGRGGFAGLLLGSVGTRLLHLAPCPLLVVPSTSRVDGGEPESRSPES